MIENKIKELILNTEKEINEIKENLLTTINIYSQLKLLSKLETLEDFKIKLQYLSQEGGEN